MRTLDHLQAPYLDAFRAFFRQGRNVIYPQDHDFACVYAQPTFDFCTVLRIRMPALLDCTYQHQHQHQLFPFAHQDILHCEMAILTNGQVPQMGGKATKFLD
jgi:hypothetical protein